VLLGLSLAPPGRGETEARRDRGLRQGQPNFLFFLCDDLGYGDLACFGHRVTRTPRLDGLAREGMKLTSCYAGAPVCSPSRAAFLTGRIPNRSGVRDWIPENSGIYLPRREVTVAEVLKAAGYRTALVGKWHLSSRMDGTEPLPGDQGFDHWFATQNNASPSHENPVNFVREGRAVGPLRGNSSRLIADEGIQFLKEAQAGPFALFIWFHAPHEPVAAPEDFTRAYAAVDDPTKRTYYGSISLMDHEVGRLLDTVDELGLREKTLVLFTSDNGPETLKRYRGAERSHGSPGPLRGMKLHLYEGGYRVPGIVRWSGLIRPGQVSDEPICGTDILPTVCDLIGASLPAGRVIDGASFVPLFSGGPVRRQTPLYWQYDRAIGGPWRIALRVGPWKLLGDAGLNRFALYNLADDVGETRDLAAEQPERVRTLTAQMTRLHRAIEEENAGR
jgi:arylsulfatase A